MKTAMELLKEDIDLEIRLGTKLLVNWDIYLALEKMQMGYTKEDVLKAEDMGEICDIDTRHIVSYLDEAKHENEKNRGQ
jgi:hypothetical protein